jgi:hypothetical protein
MIHSHHFVRIFPVGVERLLKVVPVTPDELSVPGQED